MLGALFLSNSGTALQLAAQAWFIWNLSHRPASVRLLGLVQATPLLGLPLLGGLLTDRFPRQRLLLMNSGSSSHYYGGSHPPPAASRTD